MTTARIIPFTPGESAPIVSDGQRARVHAFSGPASTPAPAPLDTGRAASQRRDDRLDMLAKIHMALDDLRRRSRTEPQLGGFSEDVYRFFLRDNYGKDSAADLDNRQLDEVLRWLKSLGWKPRKRGHRRTAPATLTHDPTGLNRKARMEKIEAMLAEKGRVEKTDMPWGYAVAILKRQTAKAPGGQVKRFEDATPAHLDDVIAALYRDATRHKRKVR